MLLTGERDDEEEGAEVIVEAVVESASLEVAPEIGSEMLSVLVGRSDVGDSPAMTGALLVTLGSAVEDTPSPGLQLGPRCLTMRWP